MSQRRFRDHFTHNNGFLLTGDSESTV